MTSTEASRLDHLITRRGLAGSRTEAQRLVESGSITVDGEVVSKSNRRFDQTVRIELIGDRCKYVSRGGVKLEHALSQFDIDVHGRICLDIGISTGGFTDCLLQAGASKVQGIDVGHGQLHASLADNPRLTVREGVNARYLTASDFSAKFDIVVIDVSFISITLLLMSASSLMAAEGKLICLIKPQFEVGAGKLNKGGIVTSELLRTEARESVHRCALAAGLKLIGTTQSPIVGGDGNIEFLSVFELT